MPRGNTDRNKAELSEILPWARLHVGDTLAAIAEFDGVAQGIAVLLFLREWQTHGEGLPADEERLRRLVSLDPKEWEQVRGDVLTLFDRRGERLHSQLVERELEAARDWKRFTVQRARRAAKARWSDASSNASSTPSSTPSSNASSTREAMLEQCHPSPSPSPSPSSSPSPTTTTINPRSGDDPSSNASSMLQASTTDEDAPPSPSQQQAIQPQTDGAAAIPGAPPSAVSTGRLDGDQGELAIAERIGFALGWGIPKALEVVKRHGLTAEDWRAWESYLEELRADPTVRSAPAVLSTLLRTHRHPDEIPERRRALEERVRDDEVFDEWARRNQGDTA